VPIPPSTQPRVRFGPFELDPATGELRKSGILIKLQPQPFRVLRLLTERAGTMVTREEIQRCLWTESTFVDFEHGINFSINQIRGALADNAEKPRYIETLPRRGYRFIAEVSIASNGKVAAKINGKGLEKDQEASYPLAPATDTDLEILEREKDARFGVRWREMTAAGVAMLIIACGVFWFAKRQSASNNRPLELKLRQLTSNSSENPVTNGAISPDGKYLAFTDAQGMHIKLIETGQIRSVSHPETLNGQNVAWKILSQWFPDSTRFLANAHPAGESPADWSSRRSSIWIVSVLGGPPLKLRDEATASSISPDGALVAFGTNNGRLGDREIWLMDANGENARKLFEASENKAIGGLRWFPKGQRVWYGVTDKSGTTLVSRELSGGPITDILPPFEMRKIWDLVLLPDGRLLYTLPEIGAGSTCNYWVLPLDERTGAATDKPRRLTNWAGACPFGTSTTADGKKLMFLKWVGRFPLYVADLSANGKHIGNPRRFAASEGWDDLLDWTGDSKSVVFRSNRNGHFGVFKQSLGDDTAESLVAGANDAEDGRVSPDGAWVVYFNSEGKESSAPMQVLRVPVRGGPPQPVMTARAHSEFRCARAPSGLCVISELGEDGKEFVITAFDPLRGRGPVLARVDTEAAARKFRWDLSADGAKIAYAKSPETSIEILSFSDQMTRVISLKGWKNLASLDWSADGNGFFVSNGVPDGIVLLHVDLLGNAQVLWTNQEGGEIQSRPSPDGRHLAIRDSKLEGNIWTMEGF
jgi:eukaryotic-like serine/threonine-protein kinase